ncbi:MAG: family hydrolase [Flavisolibacter sp.]|jgi:putative hydrolase of the HAD superfamily|nr:family hydrolase [Flavisolibacter sp.]
MNIDSLKVLFLDIGGVLLSNGWGHVSRQAAAKKFGFDYDKMNYLHEFIFDIYEEGKVSLDDYLDSVLFDEPRSFSREEFKEFMLQESKELPQLLPWLIEWKQQHPGIKVFSINNEPKDLNDHRIKTFGLRRLFDGFISSCDVGLRKPDPQIFKLALAVAAIEPHECIYIDDREVLTRAGAKSGMHCWQHKTFEETKKFLEGL